MHEYECGRCGVRCRSAVEMAQALGGLCAECHFVAQIPDPEDRRLVGILIENLRKAHTETKP